jgi:hypothetical protein
MNNLPMTMPEAEAIKLIVHWIDLLINCMTSDAGHRVLQKGLCNQITNGTLPCMQVIAAAESGQPDADAALRVIAAEYLGRREGMPTELANYVQRVLVFPLIAPASGRTFGDNFMRDIAIYVCLDRGRHRIVDGAANSADNRKSRERGDHRDVSARICQEAGDERLQSRADDLCLPDCREHGGLVIIVRF